MKPFWLFIIFYSVIFVACQRKAAKIPVSATPAPVSSSFDKDEKILFLGLNIVGDDSFRVDKITLIQSKSAVGRTKSEPEELKEDGSMTLAFIAKDGSVLKEYTVGNPLVRRMEFTNAAGELQTREVKAKQIEYTFRSNIPPGSSKVFIHAADTGKKLLEIDLN